MNAALQFMQRGELVPDVTVLELVRERVGCLRCGGGFLLDGFPRTVAQAEAVTRLLQAEEVRLDAVVNYELPLEEIVARLSGRRTCARCKAVFHVSSRPPRRAGICDQCGGELIQREDDRPESVRVRMQAYQESTAPLVDYYRRLGLLASMAATGTPEEICERTLAVLEQRRRAAT
jgi:adenylate kinase